MKKEFEIVLRVHITEEELERTGADSPSEQVSDILEYCLGPSMDIEDATIYDNGVIM